MPATFKVAVVASPSVRPPCAVVPAAFTVRSRVPAAAVTVVKPPTALRFTVVIPLPVKVAAPVALVIVTVFNVLPVDAAVSEVSVTSTVVKAVPVATAETDVALFKVTLTAPVVLAPALVMLRD